MKSKLAKSNGETFLATVIDVSQVSDLALLKLEARSEIKFPTLKFGIYIVYRFGICCTTVSRNFYKVLDMIDVKLSNLKKWPDCETSRETLPSNFRRFYKNVLS